MCIRDRVAAVFGWLAVRHLGKQLRILAGLYADHELIRTGPYAICLLYTSPDPALAPQAAAALGQLKASWPAEDFRSYLDRPVIRRMHAELLRVDPAAPTTCLLYTSRCV